MRYQLNDKERSKQQPLRLSICITFIVYVRTGIAVSNQNRISRKDRKKYFWTIDWRILYFEWKFIWRTSGTDIKAVYLYNRYAVWDLANVVL